jgi:outer membrane receptor protein involved in Fe transport
MTDNTPDMAVLLRKSLARHTPKNFTIFFLFSTIIGLFFMQTCQASSSIRGKIINDRTRQPIPSATIQLTPGNTKTTSDQDGNFSFEKLKPGNYLLAVSHVSFYSQVRQVTLPDESSVMIEFSMQSTSHTLPGIVVTPSRMSQSQFRTIQNATATSSEKFGEKQFSTTAELIRGEPGVLIQKTTHGHGSPIIRGLIGKYVLLLYDGIRLNKPTFRFGANQYLNTVNAKTLGGIEVTRGPSSVIYGSDAIGGVINLIPMRLPNGLSKPKIDYKFSGEYSSIDNGSSYNIQLMASAPKLAATYSFSYKDIGHLDGGGDIDKQIPTGWTENAHTAQITFKANGWLILKNSLQIVKQNKVPRYDKYVSGDFVQYVYDPQDRDLGILKLTALKRSPLWDAIETAFSYQRDSEGRTTQKAGSNEITNSIDRLTTWGGYIQFSRNISFKHTLIYGGDYYRHRIKSSAVETINSTNTPSAPTYPDDSYYRSVGIFVQNEYTPNDYINISAGIRYSNETINSVLVQPEENPYGEYSPQFDDLSGSLAISYLIDPSVNLIGRWSRGFRAPNFNDALALKYSSSGYDAPSFNLKPEISNSYELGIKLSASRITGTVFLYYNQLTNLIDRQPGTYNGLEFFDENNNGIFDDGEPPIFQKFNIDRAYIHGCEYESHIRLSSLLAIRNNLTWTYGQNQTKDEPLSRIPPLMGMIALKLNFNSNLWWELKTQFAGAQRRLSQRDIDDTRIESGGTPGWITLNSFAQYKIHGFTISAIIHNILDKKYKTHGSGIYSPGRGIVISLIYSSF